MPYPSRFAFEPTKCELNSFVADEISSRAAVLMEISDLDALIAELDPSIVEYDEPHCIAPLLHARSPSVTLQRRWVGCTRLPA
jgi:hypothetical protein